MTALGFPELVITPLRTYVFLALTPVLTILMAWGMAAAAGKPPALLKWGWWKSTWELTLTSILVCVCSIGSFIFAK